MSSPTPSPIRRLALVTATALAIGFALPGAVVHAGKASPVLTVSSCTVHAGPSDVSASGGWTDLSRVTEIFLGITGTNTRPTGWSSVSTSDWSTSTRTSGSFSVSHQALSYGDTTPSYYVWLWVRQGRNNLYSDGTLCS